MTKRKTSESPKSENGPDGKKTYPLKGTIFEEMEKVLDKIPGNNRLTQDDIDSYHDRLKDLNEIQRQGD